MQRITLASMAFLALALNLAGCSSDPPVDGPIASASPVSMRVTRGDAELLVGDAWLPAADDATRAATAVRSGGAVTEVAVGDSSAPAVLWLQSNTEVTVSADATGGWQLDVVRGTARLSLPAYQRAAAAGEELSGDMLIEPGQVRRTVGAVMDADWSLLEEREVAAEDRGIGSLRVDLGDGVSGDLALTSLSVDARVEGDMAYTDVEHVFHNNTSRVLEGTFEFPLPERTTVMGLAMNIGPVMMEGALIERQWAREIFQGYVDRWKNQFILRDPALLEWDGGTLFKLRIFPIEPLGYKRVVLRYLSPLTRTGKGWQYTYPTAAPESERTVERFRVRFNGEIVTEETNFEPGPTTVVDVPLAAVAEAHRQTSEQGTYTSVKLEPSWPRDEAACSTLGRHVAVVFDTSRSSLERHLLALKTLRTVVGQLLPGDRVALLSADVVVRQHTAGFVPQGHEELEKGLDAIVRIPPEGASDLAGALAKTGELLSTIGEAQGDVIYIGDGHATWGVRDQSALLPEAMKALEGARFHALVLQDDADEAVLRHLAGASDGFVTLPRTPEDVRSFALRWRLAPCAARLTDVTVGAGADNEVVLDGADTLHEGDALKAIIRTPAGVTPPTSIELSGWLGGEKVTQTIAVPPTKDARYISQRWGAERIDELQQRDDGDPKAVVETSLAHHVMSRYTAFLVLETLADYRRYGIEAPALPSEVSDGHFYATTGQLTPNQVRPGDPEVHIHAPAVARSVLVVFPFGESKYAVFDREKRVWVTRFLIDNKTPGGIYSIRVRITHHDGRVEINTLPYLVDTKAPEVEVRLSKSGATGYLIEARQLVSDEERQALAELRGTTITALPEEGDLAHVDVRLPDGSVLALQPTPGYPGRWGAGVEWDALQSSLRLTVVAHDVANNTSEAAVELDPGERVWMKASIVAGVADVTDIEEPSGETALETSFRARNDVHACLPVSDDTTLAATSAGVLTTGAQGEVTALSSAPARALLEVGASVWVGSEDGVLELRREGSWVTTHELPWMKRARALAFHDGKLYVGTWGGGVWAHALDSGKDERIAFAQSTEGEDRWRITALAVHRGELWVGTAGGGVHVLAGGELRQRPHRHGDHVVSLASHDDVLLVGTLEGVAALDSPKLLSTALTTTLTSSGVVVTAEDGLLRHEDALVPLAAQPALQGSRLRSASLATTRSCAASDDGLWTRRADQDWERIDLGGPAGQDIAAIAHDGERLYAGMFDQGLHVFDGADWRRVFADQIDDKVNVLLHAHGRLHVGTARGLHIIEDDEARRFVGKLPSQDIHSLAATADGVLVGTARGAALIRGDKVHNIEPNHVEGRARAIWAAAVTSDGRPLLGTSRGLYYPRLAGEWIRLSLASGHLPEDWVTSLAVDGDDVWVGTYSHGVVRLRIDDTSAKSELFGGGWVNFNGLRVHRGALYTATMDGLLVRPLHGGAWRYLDPSTQGDITAVLPADANLWIASRRGLSLLER